MSAVRHFACSAQDMEKGTSRTLHVAGERIALFCNDDGEFFATADSCTHEQWSLGEDGDLEQNEVVCPLHMARFDIRTGEVLCFPATEALATYPVEVDADRRVHVVLTSPDPLLPPRT